MEAEVSRSMGNKFHILMFPWLAMGHITPYLHLSNHLSGRGHKISFLLPNKALLLLRPLNHHPDLITFRPLSVPAVDGLPPGTETASDVPSSLTPLLTTALDLTRPQVERIILHLRPDFVFYDFAHWVPQIIASSNLPMKSVSYIMVSPATLSMKMVPSRSEYYRGGRTPSPEEHTVPPPGYPSSTVVFRKHEGHKAAFLAAEYGTGITFFGRINSSLKSADAIALRTCREIHGPFCDYLSAQFDKPVLLTGHALPAAEGVLEERWGAWLGRHAPGSVVFCSFGSELVVDKEQFGEILLGLEMAGYPFLVALRPPRGCSTVEEAMPEGFGERVAGKGAVTGGWVQQPQLLKHPSVGCFVGHGGYGSMWESLLSGAQLVVLPGLFPDHIVNARTMAGELKVEVASVDGSGWIAKERLCRAVKEAMDEDSQVGSLIRGSHCKWRGLLGAHAFVNHCIDTFVHQLHTL